MQMKHSKEQNGCIPLPRYLYFQLRSRLNVNEEDAKEGDAEAERVLIR